MSCIDLILAGGLADYWLAELAPADEEAVELHLLGCAACSEALDTIVRLATGIRALVRQGALPVIFTREFLERLEADGLRVRQYSPRAGGSVQCTILPQDDVLIGRLAADLTGVKQLDAVLCDATGVERGRFADIPFRDAPTEVVFNQPAGPARVSGPEVLIVKLVAIAEGAERIVGEYVFHHSPSPR